VRIAACGIERLVPELQAADIPLTEEALA